MVLCKETTKQSSTIHSSNNQPTHNGGYLPCEAAATECGGSSKATIVNIFSATEVKNGKVKIVRVSTAKNLKLKCFCT
jgi:hypothetical protein